VARPRFHRGDVAAALAAAREHGALIATTEKDWTKLAPLWPEEALGLLVVVPVSLVFAEPEAIAGFLDTLAKAV